MIVVFDFNASLNDFAPVTPTSLPVDFDEIGKSGMLFLSSSPLRLSFVSVVFDFNASLNDFAPVSPIPLPIDTIQHNFVKKPLSHNSVR